MGGERTTTTTQQTPSATPMEEELNRLEMERVRAVQPGMIGAQQAGLGLIQQLLQGQEPLPGYFEKLSQGISPEITSGIVGSSLEDIRPSFQQSGLMDSGVRMGLEAGLAGDIRRQVQEFNLGSKLNLLNLAIFGQASVQQPIMGQSAMLGQRLAGLRPVSGYSETIGMNPFMRAMQQSAGRSIGTTATGGRGISFGGYGIGGS